VKTMTKGYQGATLLQRLGTSLYRILSAIALACLIGIPLGVLVGVSESSRALLNLLTRAHVVDMGIRRFCRPAVRPRQPSPRLVRTSYWSR
jgi:ABC-type methionine transport system permease subunit